MSRREGDSSDPGGDRMTKTSCLQPRDSDCREIPGDRQVGRGQQPDEGLLRHLVPGFQFRFRRHRTGRRHSSHVRVPANHSRSRAFGILKPFCPRSVEGSPMESIPPPFAPDRRPKRVFRSRDARPPLPSASRAGHCGEPRIRSTLATRRPVVTDFSDPGRPARDLLCQIFPPAGCYL